MTENPPQPQPPLEGVSFDEPAPDYVSADQSLKDVKASPEAEEAAAHVEKSSTDPIVEGEPSHVGDPSQQPEQTQQEEPAQDAQPVVDAPNPAANSSNTDASPPTI